MYRLVCITKNGDEFSAAPDGESLEELELACEDIMTDLGSANYFRVDSGDFLTYVNPSEVLAIQIRGIN